MHTHTCTYIYTHTYTHSTCSSVWILVCGSAFYTSSLTAGNELCLSSAHVRKAPALQARDTLISSALWEIHSDFPALRVGGIPLAKGILELSMFFLFYVKLIMTKKNIHYLSLVQCS